MLGKIFGGKPKESWSDRTKAHRASLRAEQESTTAEPKRKTRTKSSNGGDSENSAPARKSGSQGFGKRNKA